MFPTYYILSSFRLKTRLKFGNVQQKSYMRFLEGKQEYLVHYIYGIGVIDSLDTTPIDISVCKKYRRFLFDNGHR